MRNTMTLLLQASKPNFPHYVILFTLSVTKLLKFRASLNDESDILG